MADDVLVSPRRFTGPILKDLLQQHWDGMRRTRENAALERRLLAGELSAAVHENFKIAGIDAYYTETPHLYTVPQRVRNGLIKRRPELSIPLGPKGVGVTSQRLTTRVEQPLNAICEHPSQGFEWDAACDILLFEGFCVGITLTDVEDWQTKKPSAWENPQDAQENWRWKKRYRIDKEGKGEDDDGYGVVDPSKARALYLDDLKHFRARHLPIRHRALSIQDCAPIFGDRRPIEGLIVVKKYSLSQIRRKWHCGEIGLPSPTGSNDMASGQGVTPSYLSGQTLTVIEGWFYDEDDIPYLSYCLDGPKGPTDLRWKAPWASYDGEIATLDLKKHLGLSRLPIDWQWGLSTYAGNPDDRALCFTRPFRPGWLSVNRDLSMVSAYLAWRGTPALIVQDKLGTSSLDDDDEPDVPDIAPMKITRISGAETIFELGSKGIDAGVFEAIQLKLGANEAEGPSKHGGNDQSGFAMSMEAAFEEQALTTVHQSLAKMYEAHGGFVLEAGKKTPKATRGDPILVYRSTDVPVTDRAGGPRLTDGPMELDPDLIDETFTVKAKYKQEMSLPERQQSAELVERRLKTRRKHLEDDGENAPEMVELELRAEDYTHTPAYEAYMAKLVSQIQGAEEMKEIAEGKDQALMNEAGLATGAAQGVMQPSLPGVVPPPDPSQVGVPVGGDMTGLGGVTTAQASLAGAVGGAMQQGPINNATAAGGIVPADLPQPGAPI